MVQRLPSCISILQSISRLPIPEDLHLLTDFCSTNQSLFLRLRGSGCSYSHTHLWLFITADVLDILMRIQ